MQISDKPKKFLEKHNFLKLICDELENFKEIESVIEKYSQKKNPVLVASLVNFHKHIRKK